MYKLLLIWRYFLTKRMVLVASAAVALLVMLVVVVLSVMSGLLAQTRERNHSWSGDIVVQRDSLVGFGYYEEFIAELAKQDEIAGATPILRTFGLLGPGNDGVEIIGVRLREFCEVTGFGKTLHDPIDPSPTFKVPADNFRRTQKLTGEQRKRGCIAGVLLMAQRYTGSWSKSKLNIMREQGLASGDWSLTVFGLTRQGTLAGSGLGDQQTFQYMNDSDSGLVDVDMYAVYVDFDVLQKLCSMDGMADGLKRANEIRIRLKEGVKLQQGRQAVANLWRQFVQAKEGDLGANLLKDVKVQTWKEYRRNQIAPAEREKTLMIVVFSMIGVVAVFIIFALFYMVVTEKIKDLGVLKSVGGSSWGVGQIFLGYGALVGLVGAIVGSILGCLIVWNSNEIEQALGLEIFDPDMYTIDRIPDMVDTNQALMIGLVAILASVAGAALPAWRAGKLEVVEALRIE